jgi:hypothetical protein
MATSSFRPNYKGIGEVLKETAKPVIDAIGQQVAGAAGPDAEFEPYTTDRAAAAVSVPAHQQAADGVLTRAVSAAGLEVRAK